MSDDKPTIFTRSAIGKKCNCDAPETVCKEHGSKRFLVPNGYYGDLYQSAAYYLAAWWTLECNSCRNRRDDFFVYKWHKDGSGSLVDGSFRDDKKKRRYPDIYRAILNALPQHPANQYTDAAQHLQAMRQRADEGGRA